MRLKFDQRPGSKTQGLLIGLVSTPKLSEHGRKAELGRADPSPHRELRKQRAVMVSWEPKLLQCPEEAPISPASHPSPCVAREPHKAEPSRMSDPGPLMLKEGMAQLPIGS